MAGVKEYKCPSCGGVLQFNSSLQKMSCPYCGTEIEVSALEAYDAHLNDQTPNDMTWDNLGGTEWEEGETASLRRYICDSCGGEIMTDESTAASSCPFCGNPVVMTSQVSGDLKPDYVIPFKLDKEAAKNAYKAHLKGKILLPKSFHDENHIDEIKGVYVPFWLFNADADASFRYNGTRVATWDDGDYIYTKTSYYSIFRKGNMSFAHVPADASTKMAEDLMESIEPFDFSEAVDFRTAYLSGYLADRYDISMEDSIVKANQRIQKSISDSFRETVVGYQSLQEADSSINLSNRSSSYALYPVWLLNTTWHDKSFTFAMNAQTGRFVGDLPADGRKMALFMVGLSLLFMLIIFMIFMFAG
ncbi:MAG: hypothetical protein IJ123_00765 [Blautia sp.]|nr:hypothetical protein [Blautia sp.]